MPFLGPVFEVELVTTARRARYYALRSGYGLVLLAILTSHFWQLHSATSGATGSIAPARMAAFAADLFSTLNAAQAAAILFLTPALVAGTIADERQRKTLHYLLASELTGFEIVLGKLAARLLHALVILAAGLPIFGLLMLFGGIDPRQVGLSFGGAASAAFLVAGISIFSSAVSRRARDAVALAYLLEVGWLVGPWIADAVITGWPEAEAIARPIITLAVDGGPSALDRAGRAFDDSAVAPIARMIGLQILLAIFFSGLAVWRLRPGDRAVPAGGGSARRGLLARPVGEDPMLWKECRVSRPSGLFGILGAAVILVALTSLGFLVAMTAISAFEELAGGGTNHHRRDDLLRLIAMATFAVSSAWLIAVASAAACGVTTEREEDTWISLIGTTLGGREILRAKRLGAFLRPRALGVALLTLWLMGLAAGSLSPTSFLGLILELVAVGWFASALGTSISLRSRTTGRAIAATLGILFALSAALPICALLIEESSLRDSCLRVSPPYLLAVSCGDGGSGSPIVPGRDFSGHSRDSALSLAIAASYALAAWSLSRRADLRFDRAVDRPRRPARTALS